MTDDDDTGTWGARSGITPVVDSLTGCQYLLAGKGGVTPRIDTDGKTQLGCGKTR